MASLLQNTHTWNPMEPFIAIQSSIAVLETPELMKCAINRHGNSILKNKSTEFHGILAHVSPILWNFMQPQTLCIAVDKSHRSLYIGNKCLIEKSRISKYSAGYLPDDFLLRKILRKKPYHMYLLSQPFVSLNVDHNGEQFIIPHEICIQFNFSCVRLWLHVNCANWFSICYVHPYFPVNVSMQLPKGSK